MEGILNLLRKLGYSEDEIKTVLNKVPTNQGGLTGTNVTTGIFSKPKEGKLAKDFLVSDKIGNPFEIDYYKGRSREDILISAEAQLKMIDDELTKLTDQIINKNLQLTQEQKINFATNLEAKKRFEKDFEAFKTKPEAEVLNIETGKKVEDIQALKEKSGLVAPPTSPIGRIDLMNKQMLQRADELFPSEATLQKEEAKRQALIAKQYEGKGYTGGTFGPSGMYRSVARDFLLDQNAKGKIKLTDDVIKNLEERNYISGGQPLMYPDPIRVMRFHYGDDVFDKIPLDKIPTGARSEIIDAMSKVEANPVKVESPVTPGGYMTPGEMKANIDELKNIERMIKRRESRFADMTEEQIQNELEQYGSKRSSFEMAFQSDHPEAYKTYLNKQEKGGDVKAALKNYSYREKPNQFYEFGKEPKMDVYHIAEDMAEYVYQKPFDELPQNLKSKLLDAANEEYINVLSIGDESFSKGGRVGYAQGTPAMGLDYLTGQEPSEGYTKENESTPSITLDTYDKAPANMDKYPIKVGDLELGISGLMTRKNSTPDPYTKISQSDRNISVRGKYNVPNTDISLLGEVGDVRMGTNRDTNVPQYNIKETIKDVMKANPYSVGIEYAPNENRNINLRYDDQGNVMLRGEYKFSKGGLGYLVGE